MSWRRIIQSLESRAEDVNRRPKLWLSVFALLMAIQISPWWYPKLDGCLYLSIARTIANGEQVTALGNPHLLTTPGYPILISPAFLLGDRPFFLLSVLHCAMAVVCILGVYVWARRHFPSVAVLLTGLTMLNSAVWIHYRRTIKEIAFMTAVIWTVNAMHLLIKDRSPWRTAGLTIWVILLVTLCAMIRYPGIVLAIGFGVALLLAAYRGSTSWARAVTLTLAVGVPSSATVLWHIHYEERMAQYYGETTYSEEFQEAVVRGVRETIQIDPEPVLAETNPVNQPDAQEPPASDTPVEDQAVVATAHESGGGNGNMQQQESELETATNEPVPTATINVADAGETQTTPATVDEGPRSQTTAETHRGYLLSEGLRLRISSLGRVTLPGMFKAYSTRHKWLNLNMTIYMTWLVFLVVGWWYLCRRKLDVFAFSLPFYIILYIVWPFDQGGRFLVPMAPLLMACSWIGLRRLLPLRGVSMQFLAAYVLLHFVIAFGYWIGKDAPRAYALHQQWPSVDRIAEVIQRNPQPVGIANIDPKRQTKIRVMLELAIDRPILEFETHKQIAPSVHWLILPSEVALEDGFTVHEQLDGLKLVARAAANSPSPVVQTANSTSPSKTRTR